MLTEKCIHLKCTTVAFKNTNMALSPTLTARLRMPAAPWGIFFMSHSRYYTHHRCHFYFLLALVLQLTYCQILCALVTDLLCAVCLWEPSLPSFVVLDHSLLLYLKGKFNYCSDIMRPTKQHKNATLWSSFSQIPRGEGIHDTKGSHGEIQVSLRTVNMESLQYGFKIYVGWSWFFALH